MFNAILPAFLQKGSPRLLRIDAGMENVAIARFMRLVRGEDSVVIGKSVHNQRIERFWRDLRHQVLHQIVDFCADVIRGNPGMAFSNGIWLLQYLFLPRIRQELLDFKNTWNHHSMRTVSGALTPNGQTHTGRRVYYNNINIDDDALAEIVNPIVEEYEGRESARGVSPFQTLQWENAFKASTAPLDMSIPNEDWFDVLQNAVNQVHIHLEIERGDM